MKWPQTYFDMKPAENVWLIERIDFHADEKQYSNKDHREAIKLATIYAKGKRIKKKKKNNV